MLDIVIQTFLDCFLIKTQVKLCFYRIYVNGIYLKNRIMQTNQDFAQLVTIIGLEYVNLHYCRK